MQIKVNGAVREFEAGLTVQSLLDGLGLQGRLVIVELNREIVTRERYGEQILHDGDVVELVHFVGGGV